MDPLSAIGLASAVVQFIDFGLKVAKRLEEFNSKQPGDVPKSLQNIAAQLPLLLNALGRIKFDAQVKNLDFDTKCILRGMISGCNAQIVEIEKMIDEISKTPGDSFKIKIRKVFTSLKYDEKVREIEKNLQTYVSVLVLHHVIDSGEAPLELADDTFFDVREKRVEEFVDRPALMEELDSCLHEAARSRVQNPTIVQIAGGQGSGKTQLVLEYGYRANSLRQFRTVFWIDASTLENLLLGFESMYATIRRTTEGSRKEKLSFVRSFLSDLWHPWLLVLDNYESALLYNDIIEHLPSRGYGGIILMTRDDAKNGMGKTIRIPKYLTVEDQNQLNSLLTQEVQRKNFEGMKTLVEQGADVNTLIWNEWPCLHRLALFGLEDAVVFFLESGADPNPPGVKIRKPLVWAAAEGHFGVCATLLNHEDMTGVGLKPADYQAAFNEAVAKGSVDIAKMIRSRCGVDMNAKNQYDYTPLQNASKNGHTAMAEYLIRQGALQEDHSQGDQALMLAASGGHSEVLRLLCTEGKVDVNTTSSLGRTALICVASLSPTEDKGKEYLSMAQFLLSKGADPNHLSKDGEGALHAAATHDNTNMILLLLAHGADPTKGGDDWSSLKTAVKYQCINTTKLLLESKIDDEDLRATWLNKGLLYAAAAGQRDAVLLLLNAGADINATMDSGGYIGATSLLLSLFQGHAKTAQLLIRQGARQDLATREGKMPLCIAAEYGYDVLVKELIKKGGDPNITSGEDKDTPLILAAGRGHEKVAKVLLENGADKDMGNKFGDTALDVAEEKGFKKVIELLET